MDGDSGRARGVVPLSVEQIIELLNAAVVDVPSLSPAALVCRIEKLLLRSTGATRAGAFLVNRWFNKLFCFSEIQSNGRGKSSRTLSGATGSTQEASRVQQEEKTFETQTVCNVGEGIAGVAALTGRNVVVRDLSVSVAQGSCAQSKRGTIVCWPLKERSHSISASTFGQDHGPAVAQVEDLSSIALEGINDRDCEEQSCGAVIGVLQIQCDEGEFPPEALDVLRDVGRLVVPLLMDSLALAEERVRQRTTEALYSLSEIDPREMGLVAMVEEVVAVAERLTAAERVCLFFVDDVADELWVAKSVDFDDAKIKVGQGLCGNAAATGLTVNVIDCYEDSRFDSRWDKQTGFVTRSVLCVPIPPPDQESVRAPMDTGEDRWTQQHPHRRDEQSSDNREQDEGAARSTATAATTGGRQSSIGGTQPSKNSSWSQRLVRRSSRPKPMAVLEVMNKRGGGVFDEHEEMALVRLCAYVESLLRRKAAEVALLKSGMTERSYIRMNKGRDGADGRSSSNYARVESTIMRLYSESVPSDAMPCERERPSKVAGQKSDAQCSRKRRDANICCCGARAHARDESLKVCSEASGSESGESNVDPHASGGCEATAQDGRDLGPSGEDELGVLEEGKGKTASSRDANAILELLDLNMNVFEMKAREQLHVLERFYHGMGLMDTFQVSARKLRNFVLAVEKKYHPNPFHNLSHAVSVTQVAFTIVKTTRMDSLLRPLDKLALLTAAFCHDIDHPGNNNAYEVNTLSPLALQHGDCSVLERHHIHVAYQVLLQDNGANNIMSELSRAQFREARQMIVQAILATDMSRHMQHCANLAEFAQRAKCMRARRGAQGHGDPSGRHNKAALAIAAPAAKCMSYEGRAESTFPESPAKRSRLDTDVAAAVASSASQKITLKQQRAGRRRTCRGDDGVDIAGRERQRQRMGKDDEPRQLFSVDRVEDRLFLTKSVIHCADLSGQVLNNELALEWSRRILEEFRTQAELEARDGLPLTTVASEDLETTMKGQHFFVARIVKPLWQPFVTLFPELEPLLGNLNNNCEYYQREAARLEETRLMSVQPSPAEAGSRAGGASATCALLNAISVDDAETDTSVNGVAVGEEKGGRPSPQPAPVGSGTYLGDDVRTVLPNASAGRPSDAHHSGLRENASGVSAVSHHSR